MIGSDKAEPRLQPYFSHFLATLCTNRVYIARKLSGNC
jgi:hypothetical protein